MYGNSVVQLADPVNGGYCSGTLIRGPDERNFILTARHCYQLNDAGAAQPLSSHVALFNYRVPCNTTSESNLTQEFPDFLQGLSFLFSDELSDILVLELLQDIPPEWSVTYAGWDASYLEDNFTFVDISHPMADVESLALGVTTGKLSHNEIGLDGSLETVGYGCEGIECGFFTTVVTSGSLTEGSSGSGLISLDLDRVVGVLSNGDDTLCEGAENDFGALSRAWIDGLYKLWPGSRPGDPMQTDYEPYAAPLPTIAIGNIVPELSPAVGPASISITLQQAPTGPLEVKLRPDKKAFRVSLSPETLTFDETNWNVSQFVTIDADGTVPLDKSAEEFRIHVSWPAAWDNGTAVERTKTVRGIARPPVQGTSFLNPITITNDEPYLLQTNFEHDGPFIPGVTFLYNRTSDDVLLVVMCPQSGTIATNSTLSLQPYTTSLLPSGPILNSPVSLDQTTFPGCQGALVAIIIDSEAYLRAFLLLIANVDTSVESPSNYTMKRLAPSPPRVLAFEPRESGKYAVWHCHDKLTTSFDVWEVSTLDVIASSKKKGSGCAEIKDLFLEAGNRYIVSLDSGRPSDHASRHQGELDFGIALLRD
ncbi:hypothetical protein QBZ16_005066 [Prototheca wickerhamii]|uniref:Peptidase S1 domain-containing protein n=1 Tax=Prototheca wickerhamii TaxID=3111 RepID=A0AAD9IGL7_PROWI|nr:hypothetical protein QBZ16_005066 [Prototheca wickerhamii]